MSSQEIDQATLDEDLAEAFEELEDVEAVTEEVEEETGEIEEELVELEPIEPPPMWGKDHREIFNQWGELENGRSYQEAMANLWKETQGHVTRKEQEAAQYRSSVNQWNEMFSPLQQELQMRGTNPQALTSQLLGYYSAINENPLQGLTRIASDFGITEQDIRGFLDDQPYVPPEVQGLRQQVQTMQQALEQQNQQAEAQQAAEVMQRIESFANATDASGQPLRPHLDAVQDDMAQLIYGFRASNGGQAPNDGELQSLYEKACQINVGVSAQLNAGQGAEDAARKAAIAKKAKTAAKRPSGKKSGHDANGKSLMADLEAAWDEQAA